MNTFLLFVLPIIAYLSAKAFMFWYDELRKAEPILSQYNTTVPWQAILVMLVCLCVSLGSLYYWFTLI